MMSIRFSTNVVSADRVEKRRTAEPSLRYWICGETTIVSDASLFNALLAPGAFREAFDGLPMESLGDIRALGEGDTAFTISAESGLWGIEVDGEKALSHTDRTAPMTFAFAEGAVNAVGGCFFLTDQDDRRVAGSLVIELSDGTSIMLTGAENDPFRGFIAPRGQSITSLTLASMTSRAWITVTDLIIGHTGGTCPCLANSGV
jgi:hypothetical protein